MATACSALDGTTWWALEWPASARRFPSWVTCYELLVTGTGAKSSATSGAPSKERGERPISSAVAVGPEPFL